MKDWENRRTCQCQLVNCVAETPSHVRTRQSNTCFGIIEKDSPNQAASCGVVLTAIDRIREPCCESRLSNTGTRGRDPEHAKQIAMLDAQEIYTMESVASRPTQREGQPLHCVCVSLCLCLSVSLCLVGEWVDGWVGCVWVCVCVGVRVSSFTTLPYFIVEIGAFLRFQSKLICFPIWLA